MPNRTRRRQQRRQNTTERLNSTSENNNKIIAKKYVEKVKKLREKLKEIQKEYKAAKAEHPPNQQKMRNIENKKGHMSFPTLPSGNTAYTKEVAIIKHITMKERWNIVACGTLFLRPLSDKRKIGEGLVDKINSTFEPMELAYFIKFVVSKNYNKFMERHLKYGEAPENAPSYSKGSYNSKDSGIYGFPPKYSKNSSDLFEVQPPSYKTKSTIKSPPSYHTEPIPTLPSFSRSPSEGGSNKKNKTKKKYKK